MILKKIEINNFGPFYGTHVWDDLQPEDGKPLILIRAYNDVAKSTILKIFNFCLYGLTPQRRQMVINRKAAITDNGESSVLFSYTHKGDDWEIKRTLKFSKVAKFLDPPEISLHRQTISHNGKIICDPNGTPGILYENDFKDKINEIIPQEISQFFFFDGERIQDYVTEEPKPSITASIEKILGIKQLLNARQDITKVESGLSSELLSSQEKDEETKKDAQVLIERNTLLEVDKAKLNYDKSDLTGKEDTLKNLKSFLETQEGLEDDWKKINLINGALVGLESSVASNIQHLKKHNSHNLLSEIISLHFKPSATLTSSFSPSQITMAKKSLETGKCDHCEEPLSDTKKAELKTIAEVKFDPFEEDMKEIISKINNDPELSASKVSHQKLVSIAAELDGKITQGQAALGDLQASLKDSASTLMEEVKTKQSEYDRLLPLFEQAQIDVANLETKYESDKANYDSDVNALSTSTTNEEVILAQARLNICKKTFRAFDEIINSIIDSERESIAEQMSKTFTEQLTNNPELYTGLNLDKEYKLLVKQQAFDPLPAWKMEPSSGMSAMIAFAFIHSLNTHSHTEAPIVIDTPTGRLDGIHKKKIITFWKNFGKQIFILYQPDEMTSEHQNMTQSFVTKHFEAIRKPGAMDESLLKEWEGDE